MEASEKERERGKKRGKLPRNGDRNWDVWIETYMDGDTVEKDVYGLGHSGWRNDWIGLGDLFRRDGTTHCAASDSFATCACVVVLFCNATCRVSPVHVWIVLLRTMASTRLRGAELPED